MSEQRHPMQPTHVVDGIKRFRCNALVLILLNHGRATGLCLNELSRLRPPESCADDWTQLAQLMGYSVDGFLELSYVDDEAAALAVNGKAVSATECEQRLHILRNRERAVKRKLRDGVAELYGIHPDDLMELDGAA